MNFWSELQQWQTAISSIVGFVGVILALLFNARAARHLQIDNRRADREAVTAAMLGELRVARNSCAANEVRALEAGSRGLNVPTRPVTGHVVNAMLAKPNGLSADTIEKVVVANALIEELPHKMLMLASLSYTEQAVPGTVYVPPQHTATAAEVMKIAKESAAIAIRALEADRENNRQQGRSIGA